MSSRMTEERRDVTIEKEAGAPGSIGPASLKAAALFDKVGVSPPRRKRWIILAALALIAAAALLFNYVRRDKPVEVATTPEANMTGTVKFLMEQQWRIRMKLALVEEQTVARQVTATGRVIPAANHQAVD